MKKKNTQAITLGGIFTAIYAVVSLISIYFFPSFSIVFPIIFSIFCAYYATIFSFKETLLFNLATLLLCFLVGIGDPFFTLLYVLPTLIVGDTFGLLNHLKIKTYLTIFLQSIVYFFTNLLTFYLAELIYDIKIVSFIILDKWLYQHFLFCIFFILSLAETIFSFMFIQTQFKKVQIIKEKEKKFPYYGYFLILIFYLLACLSFNFSKNLSNLFNLFVFIYFIFSFIETLYHKKYSKIYSFIFLLGYVTYIFIICGTKLIPYFTIFVPLPILIYSIVKLSIYIYNINKKRRLEYE